MIEIASRAPRRSIAGGMSIRYLFRAVEEYIRDRSYAK